MLISPLVTVITPTFNRAYILPTAIKSVLVQKYTNFEYIIVDDGSTDNTPNIVKAFNDRRIIYVKNRRTKGVSGARNTGMDFAKGEWITFLDSDDEWYPNLLEVMVKNVTKDKETMFAVPRGEKTMELYEKNKKIKQIDTSDNYPEEITTQDIAYKNFRFDNIGLFLSRKVITDGIRFDENEDLGCLEDWEFALQLCERYPYGLLYIKEKLFHYHQRYGTDGRVSNDTYKKTVTAFEYVYNKYRNSKLLKGQSWYPQRVEKYKKLQRDFELGKAPPKYLLPFIDH